MILSRFDQEIKEKKKILSSMKPYASSCKEIDEKINELINSLNVDCGKSVFMAETVEIVNEYKIALKNPITMSDTACPISGLKQKLEKEYFAIANKTLLKNNWYDLDSTSLIFKNNNQRDECPVCKNSDKTLFDTDDCNRRTCTVCFTNIMTLEIGNTNLDYNRATVTGKFIYNRVLHFQECIKQFQGKQHCKIPQSIYDKLEQKFNAYRLLLDSPDKRVKYSKITKQHILMFLKDTPKHYENVNVIFSTLTGKSGEDISHLEHQLVDDFKELVTLYDNLHGKDKSEELDRKNFLNVQYVLFQLLKRHGYQCKVEDFSMLKTTERKLFHDQICSSLFLKLGWNFTKTF